MKKVLKLSSLAIVLMALLTLTACEIGRAHV